MHKKYFNFILPIFGAVVVVGSGFSAWVFSDSISKTQNISGDIELKPLATLSAELVSNVTSFKVNLDQGGLNNADEATGITFTDFGENATTSGNKLSVSLTYTLTSDVDLLASDWTSIQDASEFTVTATLPGRLGDFLTVTVPTEATKFTFSAEETATSNLRERVGTATFEIAVSYAEGKKPTSKTEYEALNTAVTELAELPVEQRSIKVGVTATTFKPANNA